MGNQLAYPSSGPHLLHVPPPNSVYPVEDEPGEEDCRLESRFGTFWVRSSWVLYAYDMFSGGGCGEHLLGPTDFLPCGEGVRPDKSQREPSCSAGPERGLSCQI